MSIYLITGATSDVGCHLIDSLVGPEDTVIAQGCGDLKQLAPLCQKFPGQIGDGLGHLCRRRARDGSLRRHR